MPFIGTPWKRYFACFQAWYRYILNNQLLESLYLLHLKGIYWYFCMLLMNYGFIICYINSATDTVVFMNSLYITIKNLEGYSLPFPIRVFLMQILSTTAVQRPFLGPLSYILHTKFFYSFAPYLYADTGWLLTFRHTV